MPERPKEMFPHFYIFDKTIDAYDSINFLSTAVMLIIMFLQYRKKETMLSGLSMNLIRKHRHEKSALSSIRFYAVAETIVLAVLWYGIVVASNWIWAKLVTNNHANYFGVVLFAGPIFYAICRLLKVPAREQLDLFTPATVINLAIGKISCFCCGCCNGIEMKGSFYYSRSRLRYEFPVQLLEAVVAIAILVVIYTILKKRKKAGLAFPVFVFLYGITRFFTEFLRDDFPTLLGPLNINHFQCAATIVVGIAEILFIHRRAYK